MAERTRWQKIARRIRVPLGFVFAGVFLWLAEPTWKTMLLSLLLVVPGVWLRAYAAEMARRGLKMPFECISRADRLNAEAADLLAEQRGNWRATSV